MPTQHGRLRILFCLLLALSSSAMATNTVVGTCKPGNRFQTIQEAVNATSAGGTVFVCPGTYSEQVVINIPLTLKGGEVGNSAAATITPPSSGLLQNGTLSSTGQPIAAQVLIQTSSGPVTINDITIDGTGATCQSQLYWAGIAYAASSNGTIMNAVVRNVTSKACQYGTAISTDRDSNVTIQKSNIHDCWNGVRSSLAKTLTIRSNTIAGGFAPIFVGSMGGPLAISANTLAAIGAGEGIDLDSNHTSTTLVSGNYLYLSAGASGIGVTQSQNTKVTGNKISGGAVGINLAEATGALVQANTITNSKTAMIINDSAGPANEANLVTDNTVNEASCGINTSSARNDTFFPNVMLNVVAITCP